MKTELLFYTLLDNSKLEQVLMFFAYTHAMGSSVRALSNKLAYLFLKDNRFDDFEEKRKKKEIHCIILNFDFFSRKKTLHVQF